MDIRRATLPECIAFGRLPAVYPCLAWVGERGGETMGIGGLTWADGRCWLWFNSITPGVATALNTVRMARRALASARQLGEKTVYLTRDGSLSTSEKLVSMLGFIKTNEFVGDVEVWECRVLN
jgi:hypothetical protein